MSRVDFYKLLRPIFMSLDAEFAHKVTVNLLKTGLVPKCGFEHPALETNVFGKKFKNPLGLAAGFDKDAEVLKPLLDMGFGFVEAGTVTPKPQAGNPKPRVFRDVENRSVINRMGFPGKGIGHFKNNIAAFRGKQQGIVGVNIGINKDAVSPLEDYRQGMTELASFADYMVINVSSPNTLGLRSLQAKEELDKILSGLQKSAVPLLLKIAPDLDMQQKTDIAEVVLARKIDGLIVSNTTVARPEKLAARLKSEKGGLSGALLKDIATQTIRDMYRLTGGRLPIIGVGGVSCAEDAYEKIRAGAALVQLYTALVYEGPLLIPRILEGLVRLLEKDGFRNVSEAVGTGQAALKKVV